jgi:hypothetical protein
LDIYLLFLALSTYHIENNVVIYRHYLSFITFLFSIHDTVSSVNREIRLERLLGHLRSGITTVAELEQILRVSKSWVWIRLQGLLKEGRLIRIGSTRGARYGLRREIKGIGSAWPLHRIGRSGDITELGTLYALVADQYYFEAGKDAIARGFAVAGLTSGVPYFLQDQRPGGFLGRAIPRRYPEIDLPQRVVDWTDDHYLRYLTLHGSDTVGDLILGRSALDEFIAQQRYLSPINSDEREARFPTLADQVMHGDLPGSSVHGEHPKFAVLLKDAEGPRHVLVKFSPPVGDAVARRWADLLVAEHLGHEVLRSAGIATARSRIFHFGGRTYLEVDRFDREGAAGRLGVTSLLSIDTGFYGSLDDWISSASRLNRDRRVNSQTLDQVRLAFAFGGLIANTDRHFGNLAFFNAYDGHFDLAPIYDMLPMLFAPEHDQIFARVFRPPDPTSDTLHAWAPARSLAEKYWRQLAGDARISAEFRSICGTCLQTLEALPRTGAYAPRPANV